MSKGRNLGRVVSSELWLCLPQRGASGMVVLFLPPLSSKGLRQKFLDVPSLVGGMSAFFPPGETVVGFRLAIVPSRMKREPYPFSRSRSISCCLFRAAVAIDAREEGTMRLCSYKRERAGLRPLCLSCRRRIPHMPVRSRFGRSQVLPPPRAASL